jgi:hypothetical protein
LPSGDIIISRDVRFDESAPASDKQVESFTDVMDTDPSTAVSSPKQSPIPRTAQVKVQTQSTPSAPSIIPTISFPSKTLYLKRRKIHLAMQSLCFGTLLASTKQHNIYTISI